jgi:dTDP-4-amino-4,6-dideoxygalactose transaminase
MPKLAIEGGKPVREKQFPKWPLRNEKELEKIKEIWESGDWGVGSRYTKEFEKNFAACYNSKYALTTANGTISMWIGLRAGGIGALDEVIIPPYTFFATAAAVMLANAVPIFVDIDLETFNIDTSKIEEVITPKTKAIIPVHIGGLPCDMQVIMNIAGKHNLLVIEDAAQAHYGEINGKMIGTFGDMGSFSFQMSKNMTAGEGGVIITDNEKLFDKCFSYQNLGRVRNGVWYEHHYIASNNRMTAFQAGILNEQLEFCDIIAKKREENASYLAKEISKIEGLIPQKRPEFVSRHAYHLFIFRYKKEYFNNVHRQKFIEALNAEGIPCSSGYVPLYSLPVFKNIKNECPWLNDKNYNRLYLENCEKACGEESIWLNQNVLLGEKEDIDTIVDALVKIKENINELI